ncbi:hypothetical protein ABZX65_32985 [Streptomyces sp. NPDC003300]|uniref:hypothetical protein n=1 Tax=unclassified Streptomyces TaxID=2593676 RepID=UPI0033B11C2D
MRDSDPSRIVRLRAVEQWLSFHLQRTRDELARLEQLAAEQAGRRRRALAGWTLERRWNGDVVHHGPCLRRTDGSSAPLAGHEAARALLDSGRAASCPACAVKVLDEPS